jgi:ADP-ribose pyrophosphatase YjhB (NUDIX family)
LKLQFNFDQSGVLPYRRKDNQTEVLLITSMKKKRWIVPKGFVEFNLSAFESAKKEALEEAGVIGANETIELGSYNTQKDIGLTHIRIYSMEVIKVLDDYPEKDLRKRKWFTLEEGADAVTIPDLSRIIRSLDNKLKGVKK